MPFVIDAWLERREPRLRVLDRKTGVVLRQWDAEALRKWCDSGEFCLEDLQYSDPAELKRLVSELFLCGCVEDLLDVRKVFRSNCSGCGKCGSKVVQFRPI